MVLFGDMEWSKVGFSQKDMDFLEQQKFSRDKILGIFRVPKAIVSQTEGVNYASAKAAQYIFAKFTIKPKMERLIQQLNEFFVPLFSGSEELFLGYDNPVPQDSAILAKKYASAIKAGWMTINEVRIEQDLPEVEGGDSIYLPMNLMPIDDSREAPPVKELKVKKKTKKDKMVNQNERIKELHARGKLHFKIEKTKESVKKQVIEGIKKHYHEQPKIKEVDENQLSQEQKQAFWERKDSITDKYYPEFKKIMASIFRKQGIKTLSKFNALKTFKLDSNTIYNKIKLNETDEVKTTVKLAFPVLEKIFKEGADETFKLLEVDMEMDVGREEIQKLLNLDARKFATSATTYTNKSIKKRIVDSVAKGETMDEMKKRIRNLFVSAEKYRADRIARTETVRYNVTATEQAFVESNVVKYKEWFVNPGACDICEPMRGKRIKVGETFFKEGDTTNGYTVSYGDVYGAPLHVNCRCDLTPIFK